MTRRIAALLALALLAAACGSDDSGAPPLITTTTTEAPADVDVDGATADAAGSTVADDSAVSPTVSGRPIDLPAATARQVDCPADIAADNVACGLVDVARDITSGGDDTVTISIATMAGSDAGFLTPMVVMQGGPGGASTDFAAWIPQQPFTQVFVDQRGTGFASADADCPEFDGAIPALLEAAAAAASTLSNDAVDACAERVDGNAVLDDLLADTTTQNHAYDVGQVMGALGYERWVAYGVSYGSTIALELMRQPPAGLVGTVLDGVYPPDLDVDAGVPRSAEASIAAVGDACRRSTVCAAFDDDVEGTLATLIDDLDANPRIVSLSANQSGQGRDLEVYLDGTRAAEFVFFILYSESLTRFLPAVLAGIAEGDERSEQWLAQIGSRTIAGAYGANDEATYFAVQCHDRLPFTEAGVEPIGTFGTAMAGTPLREICPAWDQDTAYAISGTPVTSDLPALLLSGEFDPITPPGYADRAAETLSASTVVTQNGRGHGIWIGDACIASIVLDFVSDPLRTLDTGCVDEGVPVDWAQP